MKLTKFQWLQLVTLALFVATLTTAARERLKSERHCSLAATLVVDCR